MPPTDAGGDEEGAPSPTSEQEPVGTKTRDEGVAQGTVEMPASKELHQQKSPEEKAMTIEEPRRREDKEEEDDDEEEPKSERRGARFERERQPRQTESSFPWSTGRREGAQRDSRGWRGKGERGNFSSYDRDRDFWRRERGHPGERGRDRDSGRDYDRDRQRSGSFRERDAYRARGYDRERERERERPRERYQREPRRDSQREMRRGRRDDERDGAQERRGRAGERQQEEEKLRGYSRTVMDENRWRRRQQQQAGEKWGHDMFELQQEPAPPTDKRQSADTKTDTQATERASTRGRPATDLRNKLHTGSRKSRGEMYAELQMQQDREEQASKEREAREREQLEALLAR